MIVIKFSNFFQNALSKERFVLKEKEKFFDKNPYGKQIGAKAISSRRLKFSLV